jgi:hypothetical protein
MYRTKRSVVITLYNIRGILSKFRRAEVQMCSDRYNIISHTTFQDYYLLIGYIIMVNGPIIITRPIRVLCSYIISIHDGNEYSCFRYRRLRYRSISFKLTSFKRIVCVNVFLNTAITYFYV